MKTKHANLTAIYSLLLAACFCLSSSNVQAAFYRKKSTSPSVSAPSAALHHPIFEMAKYLLPSPQKKEASGFLAYLSAGCGVLGIIVGSLQTVLLILILGMVAGISGKMGLKRYKRKPFLRALCYAGIILGAILVLFATVPILFLV